MSVTVQDAIERQLVIPVARQRVWEAITRPEQLSRWFGDSVELELAVGAPITFYWKEHGTSRGRVEAVDPPSRFAYRWASSADPDHAVPFDEVVSTLVEFTLEETAEGTRVTVVESGFASLPADEREQTRNEHVQGWVFETTELLDYLVAQQAGK